jgi:energy-coupling factor transport system ATP-binding protein
MGKVTLLTMMIKAENLIHEYPSGGEQEKKVAALSNIDLEIEDGEFVVIIGHNGSGKSTLAKHFNALLLPSGGTVWVMDKDTKDENLIWDIRQEVGMVFQNPDNQLVATVVEEDVAFGPENLGVQPAEIEKRVTEALHVVDMDRFRKSAPHLLSGGQKQRIAIAGIIAMRPRCIVLDEPTAMLDPVGRQEVISTITRLNKEEKITVIHITHFMNEAVNADRVIVMEKGKIVMQGTPREIFCRVEELKALGLDVPQVTELAFRLRNAGVDIPGDILTEDEMVKALWEYL